ncbi:DUF2490 domain-containing protein [Mangrovibacterium diazotrophicum]|uniref:Uncharacterized protein DUF2490 n=1 Tax=Mangrovibacterium diazotrophicum TaxID=1261403 RepID=A0A419W5S0_9BACT|nr:DUF2490 domain-containing protein [Mangrovibacterium diazotrophicum]RKD90813.1 uncharacterized protein DUF2490 [Mangrovibacterium diazotrophicum]
MKKLLFLSAYLLLLKSLSAQERRDFYLWAKVAFDVKLTQTNDMVFSTRTDYRTDDSFRELTYFDLSFQHRVNDWYRFALAFRYAQKPVLGTDIYEYRPQIASFFTWGKGRLNYLGMVRIEQRWFNKGTNHQRIVQQFFVRFPALNERWLQPIVGEESFWKLTSEGLHRARLYLGAQIYEAPQWNVNLFYVRQTTKVLGSWYPDDILSLDLRLRLNSKKVFKSD